MVAVCTPNGPCGRRTRGRGQNHTRVWFWPLPLQLKPQTALTGSLREQPVFDRPDDRAQACPVFPADTPNTRPAVIDLTSEQLELIREILARNGASSANRPVIFGSRAAGRPAATATSTSRSRACHWRTRACVNFAGGVAPSDARRRAQSP